MSLLRFAPLLLGLVPSIVQAQVDPATIRVPQTTAWTGQRVAFFVDLHAKGSFDGAASFSLPQVSRSVIIKLGSPVVSSKEIDGDSWFVQSHEFALFSQQTGQVTIPSFDVRFASRDGFTGPSTEQTARVPETTLEIKRPPGSASLGFLVTTDSLDIEEIWEPKPGPAKVGDAFKRIITQNADEMTGIALAPPPQVAPEGVRIYLSDPEVTDATERGTLAGERRDTITYVLQQPGSHTLPAIEYVWWDPEAEALDSKILPAATFHVATPQVADTAAVETDRHSLWGWCLAGLVLGGGLIAWQHQKIVHIVNTGWQRLNPPDRVAARQLLGACRRNDAAMASHAWLCWLGLQDPALTLNETLRAAALDLERFVYGSNSGEPWHGATMSQAFRVQLAGRRGIHQQNRTAALPKLNPST